MLGQIIGSRLRAKVLGWLFANPGQRYFVRQVAALIGEDSANVSRELARLEKLGLLASTAEGRNKYYQANPTFALFEELRSIAAKTTGLADVIGAGLRPLRSRIRVAFVFGSFAQGTQTPRSDVDLFIIAEGSLRDYATAISRAGRRLTREINAVVMTPEDYGKRLRERGHFVNEVSKSAKIFVMGDGRDLERIGGQRAHQAAPDFDKRSLRVAGRCGTRPRRRRD